MKKRLLILPALILSMLGFSQGIEFEHGSWKELFDKAQQANKPIFVDVYTSWCGPCKMMSKDIFPLEEVGKVYNSSFVCYKIDAENGEGIEIAKKYEVKAYPTYLFIKPDGTLFFRALGSMDAKSFIAKAEAALTEMNDTKPINIWEKEYPDKKNDPAFLVAYMEKRYKLSMSNSALFNEYLQLLPETERSTPAIAEFYKKEGGNLQVNSIAFNNLQKNGVKFESQLPIAIVNRMLLNGVTNSLREAAKAKNEELMKDAVAAFDLLPKDATSMQKDELYMQYYQKTGDVAKYLPYATNFANNHLMKITDKAINEKDLANSQTIEERLKSGALANIDSAQLAQLREYVAHMERNRISQLINDIAWNVFLEISDKKVLKEALRWSKRSLELTPENPGWIDTYANLLYKLGKKKQAIAKEEEALQFANKKGTQQYKKGIEDTLHKMMIGEKTWNN